MDSAKNKYSLYISIGISIVVAAGLLIFTWFMIYDKPVTDRENPRIVCLGDSIIGNERGKTSVTAVMESILSEPVANGAFGGTCASLSNTEYRATYYEDSINLAMLADAIAYRDFSVQLYDITSNNFKLDYFKSALEELTKVDFEEVDIVFIEHGINDYSAGRPIDNEADPLDVYTYAGSLRYSIEQIKSAYPEIQIVLVTPLYCYFQVNGERGLDSETADFGQGPLINYVEAELKVAEEYELPVVDNFHNLGINSDNIDEYAMDGIHLNEKGRQLLANALAEYVIQNLN